MHSPSSSVSLAREDLRASYGLYRSGRADYTKERAQLLKGVTIDEILEQIRSVDQPGHQLKQ